jgi:rubrerythrin
MTKELTGEWWAIVIHALQAHAREEAQFLDDYERLCEEVSDPGARFLIELILEDERRHHGMWERMASTARGDDQATPPPPRVSPEEAAALLGPTERFLAAEREDRSHLKDLEKQLRPARDETLWQLIVDLMRLDTEKHVKILEYLRDRLREAAKP